jgi:hypothetical protein
MVEFMHRKPKVTDGKIGGAAARRRIAMLRWNLMTGETTARHLSARSRLRRCSRRTDLDQNKIDPT